MNRQFDNLTSGFYRLSHATLPFDVPTVSDYQLSQQTTLRFVVPSSSDYHGGLGDVDMRFAFGLNSESQGMRIIRNTEGIDLLIVGDDHSTGYSNTNCVDWSGRAVPVVNGGGQDHLDVDAAFTSVVNDHFIPQSGPISTRDIYRLYRYANNLLVIPMYGRDIRAVLEENASERLTCRVLKGQAYFFPINDQYTYLLGGGINFRCDLSRPAGERVEIIGFTSGRGYDPDALYLVAVNNYLLGNERCGLRSYSEENALWSQLSDEAGDTIQDGIREYITALTATSGGVSPDQFTWEWSLDYTADPSGLSPREGTVAAVLADAPEDGHNYALYHEAQRCTLSDSGASGSFPACPIEPCGDALIGPLPGDALVMTAHLANADQLLLSDGQGRYLTCGASGGLSLEDAPAENGLSLWQLIPAECGISLLCVGANNSQALEYYGSKISTYKLAQSGRFLFNFYEIR